MPAFLKINSAGIDVSRLQHALTTLGYHVGPIDGVFGPATRMAVLEFQRVAKIAIDGEVGPQTWAALERAYTNQIDRIKGHIDQNTFTPKPGLMPQNNNDQRMSSAVMLQQNCDGGQGCRYGGWVNPFQFDSDDFKKNKIFKIPLVTKIAPNVAIKKPVHGGTCSPWAGFFLSWWMCMNEDYDFRIGRSARWLATWPHDKIYEGRKIPGLGDYTEVHETLKLEKRPLGVLYKYFDWLNGVNIIEMASHVVLVLKVGGETGFNLENPMSPGNPLPTGLYRFGADGFYKTIGGKKYYSGTKQTFKMIYPTDSASQPWDVYRVANLDANTSAPTNGPFSGRTPWTLTLE